MTESLPPPGELEEDALVRRLFTAARRETAEPEAELRVARAAEEAAETAGRPLPDAPAVAMGTASPLEDEASPLRHLRRLRTALAVMSAAAAFLLVGGGFFLKKQNDESAAQGAAAEAQRQDLQKQIEAAKAEADKEAMAVRVATAALDEAKSDAARAQAQHDLDIAMQKQSAANAAVLGASMRGGRAAAAGKANAACTCNKMDPLCGCAN